VDIAWIPTGPGTPVYGERTPWGLLDRDRETKEVTGLEIWDASKLISIELLERMPHPGKPEPDAIAA
jgi:hypothetical protein